MPRLIEKGNTIINFGKHLPVPYIERVEIFNATEEEVRGIFAISDYDTIPQAAFFKEAEFADTDGDGIGDMQNMRDLYGAWAAREPGAFVRIKISVSLMFNTTEDFLLKEFKNDVINNLWLSFMPVPVPGNIEALKKHKQSLRQVVSSQSSLGEWAQFYKTRPLNAYTFDGADMSYTTEWDEKGNRYVKVSGMSAEFITIAHPDLCIFASTSAQDPRELLSSQSPIFFGMANSDAAYEDVFVEGELANRTQEGYYELNGAFYPGVPIMGLNKRYHKTEKYGSKDIVERMNLLVEEYSQYRNRRNIALDSALQNIQYILVKFEEDPRLLTKLNELSTVFPATATTSRLGRLYERFRRAVINSNTYLIEQPEVQKRLIRNAKIQDYRPFRASMEWTPTWDDTLLDTDYIYDVILQTTLAKYIEVDEGDPEAEAPYTPETAKELANENIANAITSFPTYNHRSDTLHDPLKQWLYDYFEAIRSDVTAEMDTVIRAPQIAVDVTYLYNPAGHAAQWITTRIGNNVAGPLGVNWGYEGAYEGDPPPEISQKVLNTAYYIFRNPDGDRPSTPNECTFEFGAWSSSGGVIHGGALSGLSGYTYFRPLASINRIVRMSTRYASEHYANYSLETHGSEILTKYEDTGEGLGTADVISAIPSPECKNNNCNSGRDLPDKIRQWRDDHAPGGEHEDEHGGVASGMWKSHPDHAMYGYSYVGRAAQLIDSTLRRWLGQGEGADRSGGKLRKAANNYEKYLGLLSLGGEGFEIWDPEAGAGSPPAGAVNEAAVDELADIIWTKAVMDLRWAVVDAFAPTATFRIMGVGGSDIGEMDAEAGLGYNAEWVPMEFVLRWCPPHDARIADEHQFTYDPGGFGHKAPMYTDLFRTYALDVREGEGPFYGEWMPSPSGPPGSIYGLKWAAAMPGDHVPRAGIKGNTSYNMFDGGGHWIDRVNAGGYDASGLEGYEQHSQGWFNYLTGPGGLFYTMYKEKFLEVTKTCLRNLAFLWGITGEGEGMMRRLANVNIVAQKYGWFFVDMEKIIRTRSILSQYIDPRRLENFLEHGRTLVNYYIRPSHIGFNNLHTKPHYIAEYLGATRISQEHPNIYLDLFMDMPNYIGDQGYVKMFPHFERCRWAGNAGAVGDVGGPKQPKAIIKAVDATGWRDFTVNKEEELFVDGERSSNVTLKAYLMPRNVDFPDGLVPNNYRLAAYNYNYFIDDDDARKMQDSYGITCQVWDKSYEIILALGEILEKAISQMRDYYNRAIEACAHNSIDNEFNSFFKNAMIERYEDNPSQAPWIRVPVVFCLLRDLFEDAFSGDYYTILDEARRIMDSTNPATGWLEGVEDFMAGLEALLDTFNIATADLKELLAEYDYDHPYVHYPKFQIITTRQISPATDYTVNAEGDFPELPGDD